MASLMHISRSWNDGLYEGAPPQNWLEVDCPCPKSPCGLVDTDGMVGGDPDCPEHGIAAGKTIRHSHDAEKCPLVVGTHRMTLQEQRTQRLGVSEMVEISLLCECGFRDVLGFGISLSADSLEPRFISQRKREHLRSILA